MYGNDGIFWFFFFRDLWDLVWEWKDIIFSNGLDEMRVCYICNSGVEDEINDVYNVYKNMIVFAYG